MSEKFEYNPGTLSAWVFASLVSEAIEIVSEAAKTDVPITFGSGLDIEIKINGIEVSFAKIFKRLEEEHTRMIKEGAIQLLEEHFKEVMQKLSSLDNLSNEFINAARVKLGLPPTDET